MIPFPNIDPVAFTVFDWPVHWYGLAYVASFLLTLQYVKQLTKKTNTNFTAHKAEDLLTWIIIGVLIGGRLGYILFYSLDYYLANPAGILQVWQGGMSFHGGLLGVITATYAYSWKHKLSFLNVTDHIAPSVCIGLFLGRMANFINGELYGRVTDAPWAMVFPHGGPYPRHPSQLYEAFLEGIVLFIILHWLTKTKMHQKGFLSGVFLIGYGSARAFVEFFREKDIQLTDGIHAYISQGQILSLPMIAIGAYLVYRSYQTKQKVS